MMGRIRRGGKQGNKGKKGKKLNQEESEVVILDKNRNEGREVDNVNERLTNGGQKIDTEIQKA